LLQRPGLSEIALWIHSKTFTLNKENKMIFTKKGLIEALKEVIGSQDVDTEVLDARKELERLRKEVRDTKDSLADVKTQKEHELREIEHKVKIKEEKNQIELEKEKAKMVTEEAKREMKKQEEHYDKMVALMKEGAEKMQDIYSKILERLPNVNYRIRDKKES
jgi:chromosome segregation ATPase